MTLLNEQTTKELKIIDENLNNYSIPNFYSSLIEINTNTFKMKEEEFLSVMKSIIYYIQNLNSKVITLNEKLQTEIKTKMQLQEKLSRLEQTNINNEKKLLKLDKNIYSIKEQQKDETDKTKGKLNTLENKLKLLQQREIQLINELNKREREVDLCKEEQKKILNTSKLTSTPFDFHFSKGLNISYMLKSNTSYQNKSSSDEAFMDLQEKTKKTIQEKIEVYDQKISDVDKILKSINTKFKDIFNSVMNKTKNRLSQLDVKVDKYYHLIDFRNNENNEIIEIEDKLSYEELDYYNYLSNSQGDDIMLSFENSFNKLSIIIDILLKSHDYNNSDNTPEFNNHLCEMINIYKSVQVDINELIGYYITNKNDINKANHIDINQILLLYQDKLSKFSKINKLEFKLKDANLNTFQNDITIKSGELNKRVENELSHFNNMIKALSVENTN